MSGVPSLAGAVLLCGVCAASARAQAADPLPGRVEVAGGAVWLGGAGFGNADATETASAGGRFTLFTTSTRLAAASGAELRVGLRLSRIFDVDAEASFAKPQLRTSIRGDVEQTASVTAKESLTQIAIGGAIVANLSRWRLGARGVPFVTAGAAYLRQLHEGRTLVDNGGEYSAGGGLRWLLRARPGARLKSLGLRADVRAVVRSRGVALDGRTHVSPLVGISLFARF